MTSELSRRTKPPSKCVTLWVAVYPPVLGDATSAGPEQVDVAREASAHLPALHG